MHALTSPLSNAFSREAFDYATSFAGLSIFLHPAAKQRFFCTPRSLFALQNQTNLGFLLSAHYPL
jgi:hypothetical protein